MGCQASIAGEQSLLQPQIKQNEQPVAESIPNQLNELIENQQNVFDQNGQNIESPMENEGQDSKIIGSKNKINPKLSQQEMEQGFMERLKHTSFRDLITDYRGMFDEISWGKIQKSIEENKYRFKALQIVIKHLISQSIRLKLQKVNENKITMKQCKNDIATSIMTILIEAIKTVIQKFQNHESNDVELFFIKQIQKFSKQLSSFLKSLYPRGQNVEAGQLAKKFQQFDCTNLFEYDMIAKANVVFKSSHDGKIDEFQITNTIKIFLNRLIVEMDQNFKKFEDLIKSINPHSKENINSILPQFKIGRKISQNTTIYNLLDTGTVEVKSPQIARVLIKWMQGLQKMAYEHEKIFSDSNHSIKVVKKEDYEFYSSVKQINKKREAYFNETNNKKDLENQIFIKKTSIEKDENDDNHMNQSAHNSAKIINGSGKQQKQRSIFSKLSKQQEAKMKKKIMKALKQKNQKQIKSHFLNQEQQQKQKQDEQQTLLKLTQQKYAQVFTLFSHMLLQNLQQTNIGHNQISNQQCQLIKYSSSVNDYISWIVEERIINAIKFLIEVGENLKMPNGDVPNLIKFKVNDLMRCQLKGNRKTLQEAFESILKLQEDNKIEIIKIKNRFNSSLSDAMIFFKIPDCFLICECQLILIESNKKQDDVKLSSIEEINHFIYELQRSPFKVLGELSVFLSKNWQTVSSYKNKLKFKTKSSRKQEIEQNFFKQRKMIRKNFHFQMCRLKEQFKIKLQQIIQKQKEQGQKKIWHNQEQSQRNIRNWKKIYSGKIKELRKELHQKKKEEIQKLVPMRADLQKKMKKLIRFPFVCSYCFEYNPKFKNKNILINNQINAIICQECIISIKSTKSKNTKHTNDSKTTNQNKLQFEKKSKIKKEQILQKKNQKIRQKILSKIKDSCKFNQNEKFQVCPLSQWIQEQKINDKNQKNLQNQTAQQKKNYMNKTLKKDTKNSNKEKIFLAQNIMNILSKNQANAIKSGWKIYFSIYQEIGNKEKMNLYKFNPKQETIQNVYNPIQKYLKHERINFHHSSWIITFKNMLRRILQKQHIEEIKEFTNHIQRNEMTEIKEKRDVNELFGILKFLKTLFNYQQRYSYQYLSKIYKIDLHNEDVLVHLKNEFIILEKVLFSQNQLNQDIQQSSNSNQYCFYYLKENIATSMFGYQQIESLLIDFQNLKSNQENHLQKRFKNMSRIKNKKKDINISNLQIQQKDLIKLFQKSTQLSDTKNQIKNLSPIFKALNEFKWLKDITILNLSKNKISSIEIILEVCLNLKYLDISENQLKQIKFKKDQAKELQQLQAEKNQIETVIGLKNVKKMQILNLSYNQIEQLNLSQQQSKLMSISENFDFNLTQKDEKGLVNLKQLRIDGIGINSQQLFKIIELLKCKNLQRLSVRLNKLQQLPKQKISKLKNLKEILVDFNQFKMQDESSVNSIIKEKKAILFSQDEKIDFKFYYEFLTEKKQQNHQSKKVVFKQQEKPKPQQQKKEQKNQDKQGKNQNGNNAVDQKIQEQDIKQGSIIEGGENLKTEEREGKQKQENQVEKVSKYKNEKYKNWDDQFEQQRQILLEKHANYLYINHHNLYNSLQQSTDQPEFIYLGHSYTAYKLQLFFKFDWTMLSKIDLERTSFDDSKWQQFVALAQKLPNLKIIWLQNNQISTVRESDLLQFKKVYRIDFRGNPLSAQSLEQIKRFNDAEHKLTVQFKNMTQQQQIRRFAIPDHKFNNDVYMKYSNDWQNKYANS